MKESTSTTAVPRQWVSRDPFGGWVYWRDEDEYREHEDGVRYYDGRSATECEAHFAAALARYQAPENEQFASMMLGAIERNTPPERLS